MMVCLGQRGEETGEFLLLVFSLLWQRDRGLSMGGNDVAAAGRQALGAQRAAIAGALGLDVGE